MSTSWFRSEDFQIHLLYFLCRDRLFLKKCGGLLTAEDFKPGRHESDERYIIAKEALNFWVKYKEPISGMLSINVATYIDEHSVGAEKQKQLKHLVGKINSSDKLVAVASIEDKVAEYLLKKLLRESLDDLVAKQVDKKLTATDFVEVARTVGQYTGRSRRHSTEFLKKEALEARLRRRSFQAAVGRPLFLIDDLDIKTKSIGRGDVGLVMGLYKKGKSLLLGHLADAYAKQRYNVLYITLEDPVEEVEDRMDASLAYLPIDKLDTLPKTLRKRFERFSKVIGGRIKIVDGTDGNVTVHEIEEMWERERDAGFTADVVIIDYDKELKPRGKHRERRFEFEEIYTDLRQFASRKSVFLWTAAQAKRLKDSQKIITADNTGEDIGKPQKVTMMIGLGQGEYHPDARYLFVAVHKRGNSKVGCEIMSNPSRGLAYDRDATIDMKRAQKAIAVVK